jgi:hypothetical protein
MGNDMGDETVAQRKHFAPIDRCRSRRLHFVEVENFNSIAMSALPQKRTLELSRMMSALCQKRTFGAAAEIGAIR